MINLTVTHSYSAPTTTLPTPTYFIPKIPNVLFFEIVSFFSAKELACSFRVSKAWTTLKENDRLWKQLNLRDFFFQAASAYKLLENPTVKLKGSDYQFYHFLHANKKQVFELRENSVVKRSDYCVVAPGGEHALSRLRGTWHFSQWKEKDWRSIDTLGHDDPSCVALNSHWVAGGSKDTLHVWKVEDGKLQKVFSSTLSGSDYISSIAIDDMGKRIVTGMTPSIKPENDNIRYKTHVWKRYAENKWKVIHTLYQERCTESVAINSKGTIVTALAEELPSSAPQQGGLYTTLGRMSICKPSRDNKWPSTPNFALIIPIITPISVPGSVSQLAIDAFERIALAPCSQTIIFVELMGQSLGNITLINDPSFTIDNIYSLAIDAFGHLSCGSEGGVVRTWQPMSHKFIETLKGTSDILDTNGKKRPYASLEQEEWYEKH